MNTTYAYFTATADKFDSSTSTATIIINLSDLNENITNADDVIIYNADDIDVRGVLPGDTFSASGVISNLGSAACYAIIEFKINVTKIGEDEPETVHTSYYTFAVDSTDPLTYTQTEITEAEGVYSTTAGKIETKQNETDTSHTREFNISYTFPVDEYNNDFKNAAITCYVSAYAIQTANLSANEAEAPAEATKLLMEIASES